MALRASTNWASKMSCTGRGKTPLGGCGCGVGVTTTFTGGALVFNGAMKFVGGGTGAGLGTTT